MHVFLVTNISLKCIRGVAAENTWRISAVLYMESRFLTL